MKVTTVQQLNAIRLNELNAYITPFVNNIVEGRKYKESSLTVIKHRSDKVLDRLNKLNK